ncbi:Liprin-beta-1, partial [Eurypyga helias]
LEQVKPPVEGSNFATLPPKSPSHAGIGDEDSFGTRKARSSFGRGFFKIKNNKRTASAPNLAETEKGSADHLDLAGLPPRPKETDSLQMTPPSPDSKKKARGIKKLFGKLKRSQSTTFNPDDMSETEFKRGGTRATAGPRLGWSRDLGQSHNELDMPFAKWTKEQVCSWLQDQGLGSYISHGKHWILSGQTLLQASQQDLEKELGIKHPLHRKKLQLALQALGSEEENNHGKLDYHWVTRWLDDIGLPQYKTQFDEGKVDGRMLHYMSVDDLLSLKVVSVLHHLSIKRAIQVLRINNFEPNCLRRRPSDENNVTPSEVTQWTNHRVMEWLRSVDLAEYAPNLRGSGVHGGLMVLEPRFNVETMAQLLNIPPNKTLLRRHLATHFNLLIGQEAQQQKREAMESPDYVLLTATAKVKPKKLAFSNFGSLRKKKQDDVEEYVCPMELGRASGSGSKKGFKPGLDIRVYDDDDLDRLEQMEDSEGTVRQIGAFSEGINNLTHMLKEDEMFKDFATRSPSTSITDEDSNV